MSKLSFYDLLNRLSVLGMAQDSDLELRLAIAGVMGEIIKTMPDKCFNDRIGLDVIYLIENMSFTTRIRRILLDIAGCTNDLETYYTEKRYLKEEANR